MNRGTQKLSYNVKVNEWQHKKFDPKSNFTAAPQAVVVDEEGLKYRKLQTCKCVMVGGVKTPIVPGNTTADYSALTAYKDDSSYGGLDTLKSKLHMDLSLLLQGLSIDNAKEYGGLHNFKEDNTKDGQVLSVGCESSKRTKQQEIVLCGTLG
ncbi:hypothetical protein CK203_107719 [Vitis vinifera]|uniref:Uncharacterized protein n=1 Tax=Vitis vinifera TaxID=29760 RepID=A0A438CIL8_VITVI|nr:hypothetical protein CK203_107719 [Vitis vinifera]